MLQILQYINSSFWVFIGSYLFVALILSKIIEAIINSIKLIVIAIRGYNPQEPIKHTTNDTEN